MQQIKLEMFAAGAKARDAPHNISGCKDLETADDARNQYKKDRWGKQWQGDFPKLLPGVGPIDFSGLIQVRRDILQTCQVDDRTAAKPPKPHHGYGRQRPSPGS